MNRQELQALHDLVEYSWVDEREDYHSQDDQGQANHIFRDLVILRAYLDSQASS